MKHDTRNLQYEKYKYGDLVLVESQISVKLNTLLEGLPKMTADYTEKRTTVILKNWTKLYHC